MRSPPPCSLFLVALSARRYRKYEGAARAVPVLAVFLLLAEIGMADQLERLFATIHQYLDQLQENAP